MKRTPVGRPALERTTLESSPFSSSMNISSDDHSPHETTAGNGGPRTSDIERIAVVRDGLRDEPVVTGYPPIVVGDDPVNGAGVRADVEFPLASIPPGVSRCTRSRFRPG